MKFEPKISGTTVTEFKIKPIFDNEIITLSSLIEKVKKQETANFILDTFRFTICSDGEWRAIFDWDTIMKISILENYPEYESVLRDYFGENWIEHYIRFNH